MSSRTSHYECMRAPIITVVTAVCLMTGLGVTGCGQESQTCDVADYGSGDTSGYQTSQQALQVGACPARAMAVNGRVEDDRTQHARSKLHLR